MEQIKRFLKDEEGVVYVEYALIIGLIALVAYVGVKALGTNINTLFNGIATYLGTIAVP
jgi:pilus assembly protein Flp/PilA